MHNLSNYFCAFSRLDGSHKRYFQLNPDGKIKDLFGSKGHKNERFWLVENDTLLLLSENKTETSRFKINEQGEFFVILIGGNGKVALRLYCVAKRSDLLETKTKFLARAAIKSGQLEVGDNTYGNITLVDGRFGKVVIGNYCSMASPTFIVGNHKLDLISTFPFQTLNHFYSDEAVSECDHISKGITTIGNDVWIGRNATIMSGVNVGNGAVIAANSVVTKNVEPYSIVGGNPAKHLKYRIESPELRQKLQEIAWWNWEEETIAIQINEIMNDSIEKFVEKFGQ